MSGTKVRLRVHYSPEPITKARYGWVRSVCGRIVEDPEQVTDDWESVAEGRRCLKCTAHLARKSDSQRLAEIIALAEQSLGGTVPARQILTIAKAG